MTRRVRLPERLDLPYGYCVIIRQVDHDKFSKVFGDSCAAWVEAEEVPGGVIYLDKSRPLTKRMEDLDHELDHVWTDWKEHWRDIVKQRASR